MSEKEDRFRVGYRPEYGDAIRPCNSKEENKTQYLNIQEAEWRYNFYFKFDYIFIFP